MLQITSDIDMEKDKITLPSGEAFSKWRFIDIERIEFSEEHKDKFEKKLYDKIPIRKISDQKQQQ